MPYPDLSLHHFPVSQLFSWPKTKVEWEPYRLSQEQLQFFDEYGYLSNVRMFDEAQMQTLREELVALMDPVHPGHSLYYEFSSNESTDPETVIFHALGAWRITPGYHDILWNPAFVMAASQLFGESAVRFWHDQLFCKPPHIGGVVAWHQDYSYWTRTGPIQHLTCWIGLDDTDTENGCLHYVPGSHRWGLLRKPVLAGEMDGLKAFLTPAQEAAFHPIPATLKAGEAVFHHPLMVHGSYENRSNRPRRGVVINVFKDGTCSNSDEVLLQGVPSIPAGMPMQGQFFPLLFDPQVHV
ncbi:MAG: phytanoyl-CoA dioxygenase family protein [Bacteroidetes bacterium]|nr:phytanoyl-CoA dioxygenase family protein [Bacteroidota bacterium]